jgi:hypothetical protein
MQRRQTWREVREAFSFHHSIERLGSSCNHGIPDSCREAVEIQELKRLEPLGDVFLILAGEP